MEGVFLSFRLLFSRLNASFTYDIDGNRISKTVNGASTEYIYVDGVLVGESDGTNDIVFLYDENGAKYGFGLNGETYYYKRNLQGDVIGIYDSTGTQVVTYTYDEWGKVLSVTGTLASTIGQTNPIRYRGYYYDNETGFYATGTRYYDPVVGRFVNADSVIPEPGGSIQGYNLFSYCFNNPVNMSDESGHWPNWGNLLKAAVYAVAAVAVVVAAPVAIPAIAASLAVSATLVTVGVVAVAGTAALLSGAELSEGLTGRNPVKETVGQDVYSTMEVGVVIGSAGITEVAAISSPCGSPPSSGSKPSGGKPFNPNGPSVQVGVDPNTVNITRPILPAKLDAIYAEARRNGGINRPIEVLRNGNIIDGNHRTQYARETGGFIDIFKK